MKCKQKRKIIGEDLKGFRYDSRYEEEKLYLEGEKILLRICIKKERSDKNIITGKSEVKGRKLEVAHDI